jgi:hypothetical protein
MSGICHIIGKLLFKRIDKNTSIQSNLKLYFLELLGGNGLQIDNQITKSVYQ